MVGCCVAASLSLGLFSPDQGGAVAAKATPKPGAAPKATAGLIQSVYEGAMASGWQDLGWSAKRSVTGGPAVIDMGSGGGWLIQGNPPPSTLAKSVFLEFRLRSDRPMQGLLNLTLGSTTDENYGNVLRLANYDPDPSGWATIRIPVETFDPQFTPFSALRIHANRALPSPSRVFIDKMRFVSGGRAVGTTEIVASAPGAQAPTSASAEATVAIDCRADVRRISPLIYGVAWVDTGNTPNAPWAMSPVVNRWGGNPTSRYNWRIGNVWNTANDWYFRNVALTAGNTFDSFLAANEAHGVGTAVTVPALGWVAKDSTSYSYPVSQFGAQKSTAPEDADSGNGVAPSGKRLDADPNRTSVVSTPASVGEWVKTKLAGRVAMYFIDNEPELWDSTHHDVHPEAVGYDELLQKTIQYATAIRNADPRAVIAGPSSWGWPAYGYSGIDAKRGFSEKPDRRAHEDLPFLAWYLREVRRYEQKTGTKLLDLLDVHFYPQGDNVYGGGTDPATAAKRIRQVRGLWDGTYRDESWIGEAVMLVPRLRDWVDRYAPGLGISIGEWNFGAEGHMSGGIATADALGRFGTEAVTSAYYWTSPPPNSPAFWAFRAYRNYDGRGSRFLDTSVSATVNRKPTSSDNLSAFASRDDAAREVVVVMTNSDPGKDKTVSVSVTNCAKTSTAELFRYGGGAAGFASAGSTSVANNATSVRLSASSINVLRLRSA